MTEQEFVSIYATLAGLAVSVCWYLGQRNK
jgi:hypothetical protein